MGLWDRVRGAFKGGSSDGSYRAEASVDLDILDAHDQASKLLIGIDRNRLERRNRDRGLAARVALGDLVVANGELRWHPHRLEKTCGVRPIELGRDEVRSIDMAGTAVVAVLKDGTNVPFRVNTPAAKTRRGVARPRPGHQEPPLIS